MMYGIEDANITSVVQVSVLNQNGSMGSSRIACYGASDSIQDVSCRALDSALKTTVSRYQSGCCDCGPLASTIRFACKMF